MQINNSAEFIFIGTGTSEGIPRVSCLTHDYGCEVCHDAVKPGSKNRRRNTCGLIRYNHPDGKQRNILIDCGKYFWHSAIDLFPKLKVQHIDAILITHDHFDAIGGLDDLRDWTRIQGSIPIYLFSERDFKTISNVFPYLTDEKKSTGKGGIPKLAFKIVPHEPLNVEGVTITPLPVYHGVGYISCGFKFGNIAYISDISQFTDETLYRINGCTTLILDSVELTGTHGSHFTFPETVSEIKKLKIPQNYLIGMTHDFDHDSVNTELLKLKEKDNLQAELSYDGLIIPINLINK